MGEGGTLRGGLEVTGGGGRSRSRVPRLLKGDEMRVYEWVTGSDEKSLRIMEGGPRGRPRRGPTDPGQGRVVLPALTRGRGTRLKVWEFQERDPARPAGEWVGERWGTGRAGRNTDPVGQGEGVRLGQLQARELARPGSPLPS